MHTYDFWCVIVTVFFFFQEDANRYAGLLGPTPLTTGPVGTPQELADAEKVRPKSLFDVWASAVLWGGVL